MTNKTKQKSRKQRSLIEFLKVKKINKEDGKNHNLIKYSTERIDTGVTQSLIDINISSNILKLRGSIAQEVFKRKIGVYYGLGKYYVAENKLKNTDRMDFLKRVYETFPYNYLDKQDPHSKISFYEYYTFQKSIDKDVINLLELQKINEYSWDILDPHIATRLLTSYVKLYLGDYLKPILSSFEYVRARIKTKQKTVPIKIPVTKKFEIRTLGYDPTQSEITLAIKRHASMNAVLLSSFPPDILAVVITKLKRLVNEAVKQDYRKVRIYSETQPGSGTAAVVEIISGSQNVMKFLEEHPKGAIHVEKRLKELGKSLQEVRYLLIGVYDNNVSLERAKKDERYHYYFTEHNAYLVLTPEVQKALFGKLIDDWKTSILNEYQNKLHEITSLGMFKHLETIRGIPVSLKERLVVRTSEGLQTVDDIRDILTNPKILSNMLPISEDALKETRKHKLRITLFCPEKFSERIHRTIFYDKLNQFRDGLLSNSFASVDEIELFQVKGENSSDYEEIMKDAGLDKIHDYTLAVIIFPEHYSKRNLELRIFYNWLKMRFYSENKPLVFQGARIDSVFGRYAKYASYNLILQIPPKLGIYPYSLEEHEDYDYIIGIDYTYWYERDTPSLGGGAVLTSPSGLIESIYPIALPSRTESLNMSKILSEWFTRTVKTNRHIIDKGHVTVLISRDGMIPKYERQTIQEFLSEYSGDMGMTIEAVEVRKRIAVRTWATQEPVAYYSPIKVGDCTYYLVDAHTGYPLGEKGNRTFYSSPYLIGSFYRFEKGKSSPVPGSAKKHVIESLIRLQKINYATTRMDNIKLPLPVDITHKLINFIRDTKMEIKGVGIPNSLFMI
ncbi:Piwi domain-containing protein [Thermococcus barophilus]|uniref:Piwi domain-containing protein n=1 Tax=Thermococcus barophilus TaxID=55802 RepID=A0A0S1XE74_THEBA|nr:Piwi domain-containing protein [Thermococcus barophilus]ALM76049.1 hypothetical protein TBCH5v1_2148 [Thermococcus barophilus]